MIYFCRISFRLKASGSRQVSIVRCRAARADTPDSSLEGSAMSESSSESPSTRS
ncbi:hypothetical protein D3C81_2129020 [compost metagenome]